LLCTGIQQQQDEPFGLGQRPCHRAQAWHAVKHMEGTAERPAKQPRDASCLLSMGRAAMMVSDEKRVPTNTHILIVHGQGRPAAVRPGRAWLAQPSLRLVWYGMVWYGMVWYGIAWKPPGQPRSRTLPPQSNQWHPTEWNSHMIMNREIWSAMHAGGKYEKLNLAGPRRLGAMWAHRW
jgi:hypothetical protein